jgi:hypothetical protein
MNNKIDLMAQVLQKNNLGASSSLELVHSDIMGPFPHLSIRKERYVLTFIDD